MSTVGVLGCGPGGLLVAYAMEQSGHDVVIYSVREKSVIPGSIRLAGAIPGLTPVYAHTSQYLRIGTAEGYARKVYGDELKFTGWEHYMGTFPAWDLVPVYDHLWAHFQGRIVDMQVSARNLDVPRAFANCIISTIPQPAICEREHNFRSVPYWIRTLPTPPADAGRDICIYNGYAHDSWYRYSIFGGICSIEYTNEPPEYDPDDRSWKKGVKVLSNDCDCHPDIHRVGRWAKWRHGVLLHHAYNEARQIAEAL